MKATMGWMTVLTLGVALGFGAGLARPSGAPALAQRNPPGGVDEATLRLYGTRHLLPLAAGPSGTTAELKVTSLGWERTHVLAVELAPSGSPRCEVGGEGARIKAVTCFKDLKRWQVATLALSGQDTSVIVYSLDPDAMPDPCAAMQAVRGGQQTLAAWEREQFVPKRGEPIAVMAIAQGPAGRMSTTGQANLRLPAQGGGVRQEQVRALAAVPAGPAGARLRVLNGGTDCNPINVRAGHASASAAACDPPRVQLTEFGAYDARDLRLDMGGSPGAVTLNRSARDKPQVNELAAVSEVVEAKGAYRVHAQATGAGIGAPLTFPMAHGPMTGQAGELWITNAHVTATVKVALSMIDGNGTLLKIVNDAEGLCAGATRKYDVQALAGEIPPTGGRGGGQRPPFLIIRAEATSAELPDFGPLAGTMIIRTADGVIGYPGMSVPQESPFFRARTDRVDGSGALVAVVMDVKKNWGPQRLTTYISAIALQVPSPENAITVDFYDESGELVLTGVERPLRPMAAFDLSEITQGAVRNPGVTPTPGAAQGLPDGFRGTALIRGQRIPNTILGIVAVEHRGRQGGMDRGPVLLDGPLSISASVNLPSWPDPSVPTPTNRPTNPPMTPGPGTGTPPIGRMTPSATPVEATPTLGPPTVEPGVPSRVLLPMLQSNHLMP